MAAQGLLTKGYVVEVARDGGEPTETRLAKVIVIHKVLDKGHTGSLESLSFILFFRRIFFEGRGETNRFVFCM